MIRIGTAGWQIPRAVVEAFPAEGSTLQRYAARFPAVEINSSFHRPHKPATWARWAETTPDDFRFAAKLPKTITHERRLADCAELVDAFLFEVGHLGSKLGPLIVQLPPKLAFEADAARGFFDALRAGFDGDLACEPRHPSWFEPEADAVLGEARAVRIAADPACVPAAARPGGWGGFTYRRLHGSPRMYWSPYGPERLAPLAEQIAAETAPAWVFFDNTGSGSAAPDALALQALLAASSAGTPTSRPRY